MAIASLLIVAGHSGVGKSTLLRGLQAGALPDLLTRAGLATTDDWTVFGTRRLKDAPIPDRGSCTLAIHYDFVHVRTLALIERVNRELREHHTVRVAVLTLCSPRALLVERLTSRRQKISLAIRHPRTFTKRVARLWVANHALRVSRSPELWRSTFARWIENARTLEPDCHLLIDVGGAQPVVRMSIERTEDEDAAVSCAAAIAESVS